MARVHIQFHADPSELFALTGEWARQAGYARVAEQFFPEYRAAKVKDWSTQLADLTLVGLRRVALTPSSPDLNVASEREFGIRNPDALYILVGALTDDGLRQSGLGGTTDDEAILKQWRAITRKAKALMHRGATVVNPDTGDTAPAPHHLHTPGAHALASDGLKMLALAGSNQFAFDDLSRDEVGALE